METKARYQFPPFPIMGCNDIKNKITETDPCLKELFKIYYGALESNILGFKGRLN